MPPSSPPRRLFCFGLGYVARALAGIVYLLARNGWQFEGRQAILCPQRAWPSVIACMILSRHRNHARNQDLKLLPPT